MEKREVLRPYKKQRLAFEGVLINIIQPNKKNSYLYGLVFASLYAANENIQLDHAVIEMDKASFAKSKLEMFKRYRFTAQVGVYQKTGPILGVPVLQECFMLQYINAAKITEETESQIEQPTVYTQTRIQNILHSKSKTAQLRYTREQLIEIVTTMPNDGSVEQFMCVYTRSHQVVKVDSSEIIRTVYQ